MHALGELLETFSPFLALLGFAGHLPIPGLDPFLLHGQWPVNIVQLVVEATGVAHWFALRVAPPEGGGGSMAVGAA